MLQDTAFFSLQGALVLPLLIALLSSTSGSAKSMNLKQFPPTYNRTSQEQGKDASRTAQRDVRAPNVTSSTPQTTSADVTTTTTTSLQRSTATTHRPLEISK